MAQGWPSLSCLTSRKNDLGQVALAKGWPSLSCLASRKVKSGPRRIGTRLAISQLPDD
eukprot:CAMPEP_0172583390 /NCGR_PEP_ID=MMETSP1068-20121228/3019_1 /TAXON_ID=35684 /ORGANISM="Pseudopedinella elastica, Strain CCMP716" /LENGTH=57 /DNA_ID=CAMNT_0013377161 /DNA_START=12 /DNA_END=182 /DNA_ORIENTATION=+